MRIKILTVLAFVLSVMCSPLELWAEKPLSIKGLSPEGTVEYVKDLAMAFSTYDVMLRMKKFPTLFCLLPPGRDVSAHLVWKLASKALEGPHEKNTVAIAVLVELQMNFPCGS